MLKSLETELQKRFEAFEAALRTINGLHHPMLDVCASLRRSHPHNVENTLELVFFGIRIHLEDNHEKWLEHTLKSIHTLRVDPTDPVWLVGKRKIPAPDATTALLISYLLSNQKTPLKDTRSPVLVIDQEATAAINKNAAEQFNGLLKTLERKKKR